MPPPLIRPSFPSHQIVFVFCFGVLSDFMDTEGKLLYGFAVTGGIVLSSYKSRNVFGNCTVLPETMTCPYFVIH